jgi:hypothetical protein
VGVFIRGCLSTVQVYIHLEGGCNLNWGERMSQSGRKAEPFGPDNNGFENFSMFVKDMASKTAVSTLETEPSTYA